MNNFKYWLIDIDGLESPVGPIETYNEALIIKAKYENRYDTQFNIIDDEIKKQIYNYEDYDSFMVEYNKYDCL
jgi:hypothetical protein